MKNSAIAIVGGGSWATAIVKILQVDPSRRLRWWVRSSEVAQGVQRRGRNPHHLSAMKLDASRLDMSTDLATTVAESTMVWIAVPSAYLSASLEVLPPTAFKDKEVVSVVKGFVPETGCSVSQYMETRWGVPTEKLCVVSGPSHAEEVAVGQTTFLNVASTNPDLASRVTNMLRCHYIHPSVVDDMKSLELCGMAKNIYAICAGMAVALGQGDNFIAALTAAAAEEMYHIAGNSAIGFRLLSDLLVTCFSRHSRNRALGEALVAGISPQEHFRRTGMVAEGYYSALVMHRMSKPAPTPIAEAVYRTLYKAADPAIEMQYLIDNAI